MPSLPRCAGRTVRLLSEMVDTDYDSLPSPPAPRQRKALNARSGSAKRLYGKRAAKAQAEATAAAAAAAAAVDPGPTPAALGRRGASAPARADKRRRYHSENEDGELSTPSLDGKPVRRTRSGGAKAKRPAQDESDADVESEGDEQAQVIPATSKVSWLLVTTVKREGPDKRVGLRKSLHSGLEQSARRVRARRPRTSSDASPKHPVTLSGYLPRLKATTERRAP